MNADVTTDLGFLLATECRSVEEVAETVRIREFGQPLTPEESQDVTRVKAALARRER